MRGLLEMRRDIEMQMKENMEAKGSGRVPVMEMVKRAAVSEDIDNGLEDLHEYSSERLAVPME
jgi:hypothetical protein